MKDKQWVQHISGQGEKWEVSCDDTGTSQWGVMVGTGIARYYHWLPKSEYRLCEPPDVWVDVTNECGIVSAGDDIIHCDCVVTKERGYRLRKITVYAGNADHPQAAFIVERKQ